jgi:hypothetical protein
MSITRAQIATQLLNEMAPKGEKLAYINNREAELLKRMGGAGKNINETGIKSYYYDEVGQTMGGTGFQDTSHLTGGSGDGGNDTKPTIPTIPEDYFTPSKTGTNIARVANFLVNPSMFSKKFIDDKIKEQYEKELQVAEDVATARNTGFGQAIGSQYFGPMNTKGIQSYKSVVGGFPKTTPPVTNIGGDRSNYS